MNKDKKETEKLHINLEPTDPKDPFVGGIWEMPNSLSGGYHGIIKTWCERFGLSGNGLAIGESGQSGESVKAVIKATFAEVKNIFSVDVEGADINWDITCPFSDYDMQSICSEEFLKFQDNCRANFMDWIICCATIEHVISPTEAVGNLAEVLKPGGLLYLHSVGPSFVEHRYPVDCFRFFRDALIGWSKRFDLEIDDMFWSHQHWFVVYRKK